ncbi:MAG: HupE/UreJ family protein [Bacteroidales bacterium]|nr:HupE/UreJ family protein [Bacteroidales bacterium]MCB9000013.1 HupE/UreJ family protein [Bacteroidales bacterium]MCB9013257.1 HupE/UreJ family protein [Bacteroidales bacterium]
MSEFHLYLKLGIEHIADFQSYDHILFIISLSVIYPIKYWKKILILITAFTIGHSITLALATLRLITINTRLVEFLIPLTIFITAAGNLLQKSDNFNSKLHKFKYLAALFFGLIHGMGFSNYLSSLLGRSESLLTPLFSFNVGIEIGQITILLIINALSLLIVDVAGVKRREWILVWSGVALGVSTILMVDRFPW